MDSLPVMTPNDKLSAIETVVTELKDQNKRLSECLKTNEVIVTQVSKANQRLTEAVELSVHKIPEFRRYLSILIGFIKRLEESTQREKDNLKAKKASLNDTNCGHDVEELIHSLRQCMLTEDKCIQTIGEEFECEELEQSMVEMNANNEIIDLSIDDDNESEPIVTSDRNTLVERSGGSRAETIVNAIDAAAIHTHNPNGSQVMPKTTTTAVTESQNDGNSDVKTPTRGRPAVKTSHSEGIIKRRPGRPRLHSPSNQ